MKNLLIILITLIMFPAACNRQKDSGEKDTAEHPAFRLVERWKSDTTLLVPECVLYDEQRDVIYVTNLNFEPRQKDGNGFISKLSRNGEILELQWISGMSSPKGMALVGDLLYTTDVDEIIEMNVVSGEITNRWLVSGAGMLNDIAADDKGSLFISDTDGNCIWRFINGDFERWLARDLSAPNGLYFESSRLLLASMGSEDFKAIDLDSKIISPLADSIGRGDGIAFTGQEDLYLVSDWTGEIFLVHPGGKAESLLRFDDDKIQTADIDFIADEQMLLIPTFYGNRVVAYELVENK